MKFFLLVLIVCFSAAHGCGIQAIQPRALKNAKIVGGQIATPNSWPWQVGLRISQNKQRFVCGGTLISNQWILTAAHCVEDATNLDVYLGDHDFDRVGSETIISASKWTYLRYDENNFSNDIALVKLRTPVQFSDKISPICLPNGKYSSIGSRAIVTGWGDIYENAGQGSRYLRQANVPVNSPSVCNYRGFQTSLQICAGDTNIFRPRDTCQGDSGGPLVQQDSNGRWYLAGITSNGAGCGGHGVYTRVSAYEQWIARVMARN